MSSSKVLGLPGKKNSACFVERTDLLDTLISLASPSNASIISGKGSISSSHSHVGGGRKSSPGRGGLSSPEKGGSSLSLPGSKSGAEIQAKMLLERNRIQLQSKKDKNFVDLQNSMKESLDFLDNVDRELSLVNETRRTKSRRQFEEWNKSVHGKIQEKVLAKVNAISARELHRRKLESYDKFLSITNRKPAIFRDIIIESEYDPLEINKLSINAKTGKLKDPLNIDRQKAESEMAMVGLSIHDDYNTTDRLPVPLWAKGKIESTPYGMFASMMNEDEGEGRGDKKPAVVKRPKGASNVVFDDFNYPIGKHAVDLEMPPPKPCGARRTYTDPRLAVIDPKTGGKYPIAFQQELYAIGKTQAMLEQTQ
jgi:hypothetical protein